MDDHGKAIEPATVEITEQDRAQLHPVIVAAMSGRLDPAMLKELLSVQREYEAGEARKSYTRAMVGLKQDLPAVISHDAVVDFPTSKGRTHYTHTTLAHVMDGIESHLASHGFSVGWNGSNDDRVIVVTCRLTHRDGHFEEVTLQSPPDTSGQKGVAQAIMSTVTYLRRYTLMMILGLATKDMKEPHGPPDSASDPDLVDQGKNLKAAAWLKSQGLDVAEAVEVVGRPVKDWTAGDLDEIRSWARDRRINRADAEEYPSGV